MKAAQDSVPSTFLLDPRTDFQYKSRTLSFVWEQFQNSTSREEWVSEWELYISLLEWDKVQLLCITPVFLMHQIYT